MAISEQDKQFLMEIAARVDVHQVAEGYLPDPLHESFSQSDLDRIEAIARRVMKSDEAEKNTLRLVKNILGHLFKTFYVRRGFWKDALGTNSE